jgi:hypothetical protein
MAGRARPGRDRQIQIHEFHANGRKSGAIGRRRSRDQTAVCDRNKEDSGPDTPLPSYQDTNGTLLSPHSPDEFGKRHLNLERHAVSETRSSVTRRTTSLTAIAASFSSS